MALYFASKYNPNWFGRCVFSYEEPKETIINPDTNETDMYQEDVQLIVKEGKIYYLPGKESA